MAAPRKQSDEDYWQASSASKIRGRGLNVFDDSLELDAAKQMLRKNLFEEDLEDDTINWDGSSSKATEFQSARHRPQSAHSQQRNNVNHTVSYTARDSDATIRYGGPQKSSYLSGSAAGSLTSSPASSQSPSFSEPSIDDVVTSHVQKRQPTLTEISKLEAQINFLKRSLDAAKKDRWSKDPVKETVKRIIVGQPHTLELYKSKEDKLAFLDEAIRSGDGNAISSAVLFLKDTVKPSIFNHEVQNRPVAVEHYLLYLRKHHDWQTLIDMLSMLGRQEEAAMIKYKQAVSVKDPCARKKLLQNCLRDHFISEVGMQHDAGLIQEQISLLERQLPIEESDSREEKAGALKFKEIPRACSIVKMPLITTLYYCSIYHYDLSENNLASPQAIRKEHRLTDKQFIITALNARAKLKRWNDIEALFQSKGWFGGTKMKAVVGFDRVVFLLHQQKAPRDILNKYCKLIDNTDKRIETAQKFGCHETALETLTQMKDKVQFLDYTDKLKPQSQEWFYAQDILRNSSIKWKN